MSGTPLSRLTVKELRALAGEHGIPNRTRLRKTELLAALETAIRGAAAPAPQPLQLPSAPAPSSTSTPAAPTPRPLGAAEPGLPIPATYGHDRLVLLPQDPHHVFAYWELSGDALAEARGHLGESGTPLLIVHGPGGNEQRSVDLAGGNYYLTVAPDAVYGAELVLRGRDGRMVRIVAADAVRTAPALPSPRTDESWMAVDSHFDATLVTAAPVGASEQLAADRLRARLWELSAVAGPAGSSLSSWR